MASTFNPIAALVTDDTGSPEAPNGDGTQINLSFFAAIDAILNEFITRSAKTVGGVWTWESFGMHMMSAGDNGVNGLAVRNTLSGSGNKAQIDVQANTVNKLSLEMFSSGFSPAGAMTADGARILLTGAGTLGIQTSATGGIRFFPGDVLRATIDSVNGPVAENVFGWKIKNSSGTLIDGVVLNGTNNLNIGSDNASNMSNTTLNAGAGILMRTNGAQRAAISSSGLLLGTAEGVVNSMSINPGSAPIGTQILFGTDGTGWQLRFGKNQGGAITHFWKLTDAGHFLPVTSAAYNLGDTTDRIGTVGTVNVNASGAVVTPSVGPASDNSGSCGSSGFRWQNVYGVNIFAGDVHFENGWSFTEHYKLDIKIPGIGLVDDDGRLKLFIDKDGNFYSGPRYDIRGLAYTRRTREERANIEWPSF
jgi:hypothetical protein